MLTIQNPKLIKTEEEALNECYNYPECYVRDTKEKKCTRTDMQELLDSGESKDYKYKKI